MGIEVYSKRDDKLIICGVVGPNVDESLNVPLSLLYTATGEFHFRPVGEMSVCFNCIALN